MTEQKYLYKCPNFNVNLNNMRLNNKWCDVTIRINGKKLRAHKVILAANLKYFDTMFSNDSFQESQQNVITMEGVEEADLEAFLSYAYTGEILLTDSNALDVLEVANYLSEDGIKEACIEFLKKHLKKEEACRAYSYADTIKCPSLRNDAKKMILANFANCSQTMDYLNLNCEHLTDIYSDGKKQPGESQQKFFEGIMKWIMHDIKERRIRLNDLLKSIDLSKLTADYLIGHLYGNLVDYTDEYEIVKDVMVFYHSNKSHPIAQQVATVEKVLLIVGEYRDKWCFQFCNLARKKWSLPEETPWTYDLMFPSNAVLNNKVYFIDDNSKKSDWSLCVFDPAKKQISKLYSASNIILRDSALCTCGRFLYICGGGQSISGTGSDRVLKYDPRTNSLEVLAPMRIKRKSASAIFYQGCLHVVGGCDDMVSLNSVEKYDSNTRKWTTLPSMRGTRTDPAVAALDGKLYACGGHKGNYADDVVEVYDPLINSWQLVARMNENRPTLLVVAHEGKLLAIRGSYARDRMKTFEVYDPRRDEWHIDQELLAGLQILNPQGGLIASTCIAMVD